MDERVSQNVPDEPFREASEAEPSGRAGGSSLTKAFSTPEGDNAVSTDLSRGSTSRRTPAISGRIDNQATVISKQPPSSLSPALGHLPPVEMGRVLQGQMLGHYELLEFVGGGGMGAVFRALDTMLNRIVAVKVLSHDQSDDEETLRRFKNEAQSAARLDHENIGRVHYVGEDGGWHYIVFEFIEGTNLRDLVQQDGPIAVADAVNYMLQLGDALAHAARRDVVHRDIKPSNVLVTPEGRAKLVDMGLARLHQVEHANNDLTASGVTLGTFDYISPEQARDPRSADVRSDLYSLGCTFYFMLTGRPPFPDGTVLQKLLQHQGDEPPDPRQYCPQLPDDVLRILKRLLAKWPDDRYQDPSELVTELTGAAVRLGLHPASPGSMVWLSTASDSRGHWQQTLPWLVPAVALVVLVVVLNAIWTPSEPVEPSLLGKLARVDSPPSVKAAGVGDARAAERSSVNTPGMRDRNASENRQGANSPSDATPTDEQAKSAPTVDDAAPPWLEYVLQNPKSFAADVWRSIRTSDLISQWPRARVASRLPAESDRHGGGQKTADMATTAPRPSAAASGARIVVGPGAVSGQYVSLAAALRDAKSGDVIELRYDGALDEDPLDIANLKLTIRAGSGKHPVVRFRVDENDLLTERRGMISLDGGQLILRNLHLDFTLPRYAGDHWSLFELSHADALSFQQCTVTVRAADSYGPTASIVHVRAGLADASGMMKDAMPTLKPVEIEARQSMFRGEGSFLSFAGERPVDLQLENVLLALGDRLVDGDVGLMGGRSASETRIELNHATVLAQGGLVRLANDGGAAAMRVRVECFDSILVGRDTSPMVEQTGSDSIETLSRQLSWSGDRSIYDGFASLWRLQGNGAPQNFNFRNWQDAWGSFENQTSEGPAGWARLFLAADRPTSAYRPSDFELRFADSPAIESASDQLDLGAELDKLPTLPEALVP